jgi:hypothetical protein
MKALCINDDFETGITKGEIYPIWDITAYTYEISNNEGCKQWVDKNKFVTTEKQSMKNDIINMIKLVECMKEDYQNESNLKIVDMIKDGLLSALGGLELVNDEE